MNHWFVPNSATGFGEKVQPSGGDILGNCARNDTALIGQSFGFAMMPTKSIEPSAGNLVITSFGRDIQSPPKTDETGHTNASISLVTLPLEVSTNHEEPGEPLGETHGRHPASGRHPNATGILTTISAFSKYADGVTENSKKTLDCPFCIGITTSPHVAAGLLTKSLEIKNLLVRSNESEGESVVRTEKVKCGNGFISGREFSYTKRAVIAARIIHRPIENFAAQACFFKN